MLAQSSAGRAVLAEACYGGTVATPTAPPQSSALTPVHTNGSCAITFKAICGGAGLTVDEVNVAVDGLVDAGLGRRSITAPAAGTAAAQQHGGASEKNAGLVGWAGVLNTVGAVKLTGIARKFQLAHGTKLKTMHSLLQELHIAQTRTTKTAARGGGGGKKEQGKGIQTSSLEDAIIAAVGGIFVLSEAHLEAAYAAHVHFFTSRRYTPDQSTALLRQRLESFTFASELHDRTLSNTSDHDGDGEDAAASAAADGGGAGGGSAGASRNNASSSSNGRASNAGVKSSDGGDKAGWTYNLVSACARAVWQSGKLECDASAGFADACFAAVHEASSTLLELVAPCQHHSQVGGSAGRLAKGTGGAGGAGSAWKVGACGGQECDVRPMLHHSASAPSSPAVNVVSSILCETILRVRY